MNKKIFDNLKTHYGEFVCYEIGSFGEYKKEYGNLGSVNDFVSVEIGNKIVPFIGYRTAILSIKTEKGEVLYTNPLIRKNYNISNNDKILKLINSSFGNIDLLEERQKTLHR